MNCPVSDDAFIPVHYYIYRKKRERERKKSQNIVHSTAGLEYLHVACKPALIHRDVKSRNILLTTGLGAKIADFGLTKAFSDSETHITTEPAGTMGYLDPEYVSGLAACAASLLASIIYHAYIYTIQLRESKKTVLFFITGITAATGPARRATCTASASCSWSW
jgi:serine/threonine protein kinase